MNVDLVFVAKTRNAVFDKDAVRLLEKIFVNVIKGFEGQLVVFSGSSDFVYMTIEYPPRVAVSNMVNSLKGVSSRLLRKERPDLEKHYWQGSLWSPSYYASSCIGEGVTAAQFIEQQHLQQ